MTPPEATGSKAFLAEPATAPTAQQPHARTSMTSDVYADLFDEDLDGVAIRLDTAIRTAAD
jgi:hypothetical protein